MRSPSTSMCSLAGAPLTRVPFVDWRSTRRKPFPAGRISVWRRGRLGVGDDDVALRQPPDGERALAERDAPAVGQEQRPDAHAGGDLGNDVALADPQFVVGDEVHGDGTHELVALLARVLAGELGELPGEGVGERLEAIEVGVGEVDADVVRVPRVRRARPSGGGRRVRA